MASQLIAKTLREARQGGARGGVLDTWDTQGKVGVPGEKEEAWQGAGQG